MRCGAARRVQVQQPVTIQIEHPDESDRAVPNSAPVQPTASCTSSRGAEDGGLILLDPDTVGRAPRCSLSSRTGERGLLVLGVLLHCSLSMQLLDTLSIEKICSPDPTSHDDVLTIVVQATPQGAWDAASCIARY